MPTSTFTERLAQINSVQFSSVQFLVSRLETWIIGYTLQRLSPVLKLQMDMYISA